MKWTTSILSVLPLASAAVHAAVEPELEARGLGLVNGGKKNPEVVNGGKKNVEVVKGSEKEIIIIWHNPGNNAKTTTINQQVTVTQTVTAGSAATPVGGSNTISQGQTATVVKPPGASHTVKVGGPGGLTFQPDTLNVPVGDSVIFEFLSQNHTVSQSPFKTPCKAMEGGMDTGFVSNPNNTVSPPPQVAMQVTVGTPLWFYCRQKGHCGKGMVFSINPTADKTQAMFQQLAIAQNGDGKASPITGGQPGAPPADNKQPAPPAESPAPGSPPAENKPGNGSVTPGQGKIQPDGSCACAVQCAQGAFPALEAQGVGALGGASGSLPVNAVIS